VRTAWFSARAIRLHLTLLILDTTFVLLGRWQLSRALGGNGLSWAYTFEWPLFAVYAIYVWWRILHDDKPERTDRRSARARERDDRADVELGEYNAYLESLHRSDEARETRDA
jgi:hypothetical protein